MSKNIIVAVFSFCFSLACLFAYILNPSSKLIPYLAAVFGLIPYYTSIWGALRKKQLDLSLPPIITIYLLLLLGKGNISLVFILIILLGYLFKVFIIEKVKSAVIGISEKLPKNCVIKLDGLERKIPIAKIKTGDTLVVKSGERVATDAVLLSPEALLDESVVTGESKPIQRKKGDKLLAGSINTGDYFEAKSTSQAKNSTLFQIQNLVLEAQSERAPLANEVSRYAWIITIFALGGVTVIYFFTRNMLEALSFWIAIVPVIFAIIVPVSTTIGITILARLGILVKNSTSLENLTKADTFLFDKTGTITQGKPEVEDILAINKTKNEVLQIAASIEKYSNHPLAPPIIDAAKKQKIKELSINGVKTLEGRGMKAKLGKKEIFLGNASMLKEQNIHVPKKLFTLVSDWERKGATPVFVVEDNVSIGVIFLLDKLRPEAKPLFSSLSRKGYEIIIVTGDKKEVAQNIAEDLEVTSFLAGVTPKGKVAEVDKKLKERKNIIMVGDGINDAPALAKAQVGIAMGGKGVDLTLNASDIVLLNNNIASLPTMIAVSKKTFGIIKQDVILASAIHTFTAILVILGSINLIETTIFHEISSIVVLLNTLRLFRVKISPG